MPAQFDSFGVRFLYPDNWSVAERDDEDGEFGVTLDVHGGGFVSVELTRADEVEALPEGAVIVQMLSDYAVLRDQARACR